MIFLFKSKKAILVLAVMAVVLICCKTNKQVTSTTSNTTSKPKPTLVPDSTDVASAQSHWAGTTLANLTQGYTLFSDKCTECHGIKKPQSFTVEEWNNILPGMGEKANLDSNQYKLVYHYILTKRATMLAGSN